MEGFLEIVSIIFGRYVFGKTGYVVKTIWFKLSKKNSRKTAVKIDNDEDIDFDDFNNRIIGFVFIVAFVILVMLLRYYFS